MDNNPVVKPVNAKPQRPLSRPRKWMKAAAEAETALAAITSAVEAFEEACSELRAIQEEYEEWKDNLPENLVNSALGEKLEEVCNLEIEDVAQTIRDVIEQVEDVISTASSVDLPRGFGKD